MSFEITIRFFSTALLEVFDGVLTAALKKKIPQALSAGYSVSTSAELNGLFLSFEGFSDKVALLIDIVTKFLSVCIAESDDATFKSVRGSMKESCEEKLTSTPNGLSASFFEKVVVEKSFTIYDLYHMIDSITLENLQNFSNKFFKQVKIEILVQGNARKHQALYIAEIVQANLISDVTPEAFELKNQAYKLPIGSSVLRMKSLLLNDNNSYIKNFYQLGPDTLRLRNLARLVESILNPKAYDFLRSKEQLGYGVGCKLESKGDAVGISLIVLSQESKNIYSKVYEKMNVFMSEVAAKAINELSDEDFESFNESRVKLLSAGHRTLSEEANVNWFEITEHDYVFDRFDLAAKGTKALTKLDLQEFFRSYMQPDKVRKFSVQIVGNPETDAAVVKRQGLNVELLSEKLSDDETVISNIDEFRSQLTIYPIVRFELE